MQNILKNAPKLINENASSVRVATALQWPQTTPTSFRPQFMPKLETNATRLCHKQFSTVYSPPYSLLWLKYKL